MSITTEDNVSTSVFLTVLTAYLPKGRYSTEVETWTNAVKALRDRHEKEHPELFSGFIIHERPPDPPYSFEVQRWFTHLYADEDLKPAVGAPGGPIRIAAESEMWFEFPPDFQKKLKQNMQRPHLEEKVILTIEEFAEEVAREGLLAP